MAAAPTVDQGRFRQAIGRFATGVTVITTHTEDGAAGMTASAVCSLSLAPVQLLVCISTRLPTHTALEQTGSFAVNVLGEGQEGLARRFATPGIDKFAGVPVRGDSHLPVLSQAIAYFACDVAERFPGGDHSIFIGDVRSFDFVDDARPLLYYGSDFGSLTSSDESVLRTWWERPSIS